MTDESPRRLTPSERQHEVLMALATKNPRAQQTFSAKRVTIGDLKGATIMDGYTAPRAEGESFADWLARIERELTELDAMLLRIDAGRIKRELEASTA